MVLWYNLFMNNENNTTKLGEALIQKFVNEEIMTKSELDKKLDSVMKKYVEHIDVKFEHINKKFEHIDVKFAHIDEKFKHIDDKFDALKTDMSNRFAQIDVRYNWIIGLIITTSISVIGLVIKLH